MEGPRARVVKAQSSVEFPMPVSVTDQAPNEIVVAAAGLRAPRHPWHAGRSRAQTLIVAAVSASIALSSFGQPATEINPKPDLPGTIVQTPVPPRDVSKALDEIIKSVGVPGMVGAIVSGGKVTHAGAAGIRRSGSPEPITIRDKVHLGSCTKSMTATLCAILVDEGVLRWDTTLAGAFPALAPSMHESWRGVRLDQLLVNRSGAPGDISRDGLWMRLWSFEGDATAARRELLVGVTRHAPAHEPGKAFAYSNAGFAIAGHMAETLAGKPWEALIAEKLFTPLGITSAGFGAPGTPEANDQPRGHNVGGRPVEPSRVADNPAAIAPAGRAHMAIEDWAKYAAWHVSAARGRPLANPALAPEHARRLHAPFDGPGERYAMGWVVAKSKGGEAFLWHNGSNTSWYALVHVYPDRDAAVLVVCNQGGNQGEAACTRGAAALLAELAKGAEGR